MRVADSSASPASVVIGAGMTGFKLCERLFRLAGRGRFAVTLVGEEPRPAYDRVNLNRRFGGCGEEDLRLGGADWYRDHGVELVTGDPATFIDRGERTVITRQNRQFRYDQLVLATGSRAFVPPMEIACRERVHVYRTLEDLNAILALAKDSSSVAVIGGGLLGVEAAKGLRDLGLETHIVDYSTGLLARHLNPQAAAVFNTNLAAFGIQIRNNTVTERIDVRDGRPLLRFAGQGELAVDFVVIAAGIRPRDELARDCGLELGPRGGIKVDDFLQTSDPLISAIGECVSHRGVIYGLAPPGFLMSDVLAARLAGRSRRFRGAGQSCSLKLPECPVYALGDYQFSGNAVTHVSGGIYRQLVLDGRRVVGAVIVGRNPEIPRLQEAVESRRRLWRGQIVEFERTGLLWPDSHSDEVALWPAGAAVCNCMRVQRGALSQAVARGCTTVESLAAFTGASTVCGSCKPLLAQLVGARPAELAAPGWRWLLAASLMAFLIATAIYLIPAIPAATTVQGGWKLEPLWRDAFWKQVSGFTMLGLIIASAALSLRRRIPRLRLGAFGWWRAAHGLLGALSLLVLVTHTGLSLGSNLNFLLMLNFLLLAAWGGLAGAVTALEHRFTGYLGRRIRQVWTWLHIALVWPLPALLAFHIIAVYWF